MRLAEVVPGSPHDDSTSPQRTANGRGITAEVRSDLRERRSCFVHGSSRVDVLFAEPARSAVHAGTVEVLPHTVPVDAVASRQDLHAFAGLVLSNERCHTIGVESNLSLSRGCAAWS